MSRTDKQLMFVEGKLAGVISDSQLRRFMRLYRNRVKLEGVLSESTPVGPTNAEKILAELNKGDTNDPKEALERVREAQRKADESARKARDRATQQEEKTKELRADIKALKKAQKEREKAISAELKQNLQTRLYSPNVVEGRLILCRNATCYATALTNYPSKLPLASKPCKGQQTNFALTEFSEVRHRAGPIGPGPRGDAHSVGYYAPTAGVSVGSGLRASGRGRAAL